jgi:beta-ketodecanoyl-[acyl-carrier-protein] synthase
MSTGVAITGTGVFVPEPRISNEELCEAYNEHALRYNRRHAEAIAAGELVAKQPSSPEFILKASGITGRHVWEKDGILDPDRLCPNIPDRPDDQISLQAEYAVNAARPALEAAGRRGEDIDIIILASSNLQRMYPAVAMEVQHHVGAGGFAWDASVGCSSATFPIQIATDAIRAGSARRALLVNPEIMCGHANWGDRDSHFIFGDAATAVVLERVEDVKKSGAYEILSTRLMSTFSSNIRNNGGYLNRCDPEHQFDADKLFYQQGRRVFKDVVPLAARFISEHVTETGHDPAALSRYWLHQANLNMNQLIARKLLGEQPDRSRSPIVLDTYGNTASCGSIIAFDHYSDDLPAGAVGCICSFGAGYSIGSVVVRRLS